MDGGIDAQYFPRVRPDTRAADNDALGSAQTRASQPRHGLRALLERLLNRTRPAPTVRYQRLAPDQPAAPEDEREAVAPRKPSEPTERDYFRAASAWETNEVVRARQSERRAWGIAFVAGGLAALAIGAVVLLTPLKTVEPYVIRVDNSTGVVDVVRSMRDAPTTQQEETNKFFLIRYVRARESYARPLAEANYTTVGLMSSPAVAERFQQFFHPNNRNSPLNVFGDAGAVEIKVKSVSFLADKVAAVRYTRIEREDALAVSPARTSHWVATVTFHYARSPMSETDREINPLGFQVVEYRNDPESLTEPRAPSAERTEYRPAPRAGVPLPLAPQARPEARP